MHHDKDYYSNETIMEMVADDEAGGDGGIQNVAVADNIVHNLFDLWAGGVVESELEVWRHSVESICGLDEDEEEQQAGRSHGWWCHPELLEEHRNMLLKEWMSFIFRGLICFHFGLFASTTVNYLLVASKGLKQSDW